MPGSLLSTEQLTRQDITKIVHFFQKIKKLPEGEVPRILTNYWVALIFLEASTRTRISFYRAVKLLGGEPVDLFPESSSLKKGETLLDTLKTLEAEGFLYAVIRLSEEGVLQKIQPEVRLGIINAGEGKIQHPTQAIGDWCTLKEVFPEEKSLNICFIGDTVSSRVFHSCGSLFSRMGCLVGICSPSELEPGRTTFPYLKFAYVQESMRWADVIYILRPQVERWKEEDREKFLSLTRAFQIHSIPEGKWVMHAGPFLRDVEIASSLVDSPQSLIAQQVKNGLYARMALFFWLQGKDEILD
ncbi:MAG: aspartate carbamoyltransferase [bacterium]